MIYLRKLLHFIKPYTRLSILSFILLTIVAFLDLTIPRLIQRIIDQGIRAGDETVVIHTAVLMLIISALSALAAVGNNNFSVKAGEGVARDLREAIFEKIQTFSYGTLDRFNTGRLIVRLSSDATAFQRLVQVTLRIGTRGPLMMIGSLILMFNTNRELALTMLPLLLVTSVILILFSAKMEPLYLLVQQKLDRLNTVLQENISGELLVKSFVRAEHEETRFAEANQDFVDHTIRVMQFMSSMGPVLTMLVNTGIVIAIWAGGLAAIDDRITVGQVIAFTNYMLSTMGPLTMMTMLSNVWANAIASAERIDEILSANPEVLDRPGAAPMVTPIKGRVVFQNVSFRYNGKNGYMNGKESRMDVLENINLTAEPGETLAILGATGAGKSSLINLIPRFYDPTAGQVMIDGVDIHEVKQSSLLEHIGIVPQETILFSGTVRDNICYGKPDATDSEVIAAAQAAQAHAFIQYLPDGYNTRIEERGVNLSGGQKHRIAIARAILMKPRILILDDSTSSVDVETETHIQSALDEIIHDATTFVVAQRISTVLNADKIIVIDRGKIAAQGTHAELIASSPIYQEIYDSQLGKGVGEK